MPYLYYNVAINDFDEIEQDPYIHYGHHKYTIGFAKGRKVYFNNIHGDNSELHYYRIHITPVVLAKPIELNPKQPPIWDLAKGQWMYYIAGAGYQPVAQAPDFFYGRTLEDLKNIFKDTYANNIDFTGKGFFLEDLAPGAVIKAAAERAARQAEFLAKPMLWLKPKVDSEHRSVFAEKDKDITVSLGPTEDTRPRYKYFNVITTAVELDVQDPATRFGSGYYTNRAGVYFSDFATTLKFPYRDYNGPQIAQPIINYSKVVTRSKENDIDVSQQLFTGTFDQRLRYKYYNPLTNGVELDVKTPEQRFGANSTYFSNNQSVYFQSYPDCLARADIDYLGKPIPQDVYNVYKAMKARV